MIKLTRPKAPAGWMDSVRGPRADAKAFFAATTGAKVRYDEFRFDDTVWDRRAKDLEAMTAGKCAYCESYPRPGEPLHIDHFRPKRSARDQTGRTSATHYYWLAYMWTNLYPSCITCNRTKHDRFPVAGERCTPGALAADISKEPRLLIDPCADQPADYLLFNEDGYVTDIRDARISGLEADVLPDRALASIETFGLNRSTLVDARRAAIIETLALIERRLDEHGGVLAKLDLKVALGHRKEHAMARRQAAYRYLVRRFPTHSLTSLGGMTRLRSPRAREALGAPEPTQVSTRARVTEREKVVKGASIRSAATHARSSQVEKVRLENFRRIVDLEVELATSGWTMMVGENGVGKSSILQAIAIALMGQVSVDQHVAAGTIVPKDLIRNGTSRARITLRRVADAAPLVVDITEDGIECRTTSQQQAIVLGFGSSRWPARPGADMSVGGDYERVANLFNPFVPVADAEGWLVANRSARSRYRPATLALARLLGLPAGSSLVQRGGHIWVAGGDDSRRPSLKQLSDGYQTVLAMSVAMMDPLFQKFDDIRTAEGVVLIDEIDAHLHPVWKMRIVSDLRHAFPGLQFVATTHEPLCLRGLNAAEIRVIEAAGGASTTVRADTPDPTTMSIEQLLTSTLFGLMSTLDPEYEAQLDRYYELLAKHRRTDAERAELDGLRQRNREQPLVGDSPRDRLIYTIANEAIAIQREEPDTELTPGLSDEIASAVSQMVRDVEAPTRRDLQKLLRGVMAAPTATANAGPSNGVAP